jgi:hypothetical protein
MQQGAGHPFYRTRLRYDGIFQAQMRFCNEHGLPHSEFIEWESDDQAKALAYMFEESTRCPMCGTADWEWEENKHAYDPVMKTCLGCYYKEVAREGQDVGPGVTVSLERTGTIQAAQRLVRDIRRARRDSAEERKRAAEVRR